jgi:haloalkane dehalogenase
MTIENDASQPIETADWLRRSRVTALDSEMSYVDEGTGEPVIFLHGNPTSSYLWRNVIPHVSPFRRCLAPDLIGMGASGKPGSHSYRFVDHVRYLDAWFDAVGLKGPYALVGHDWGGALAFHRTFRRPREVSALAYMETFVQPRRWEDLSPVAEAFFRRTRSPAGEEFILDENAFVEVGVPRAVIRSLHDAEMAAYRAPYPDRASRLPTLVWPREQPIDGEPEDGVSIVSRYGAWLQTSDIPKLFINAEPGSLITERARGFCRSWRNQREVTVHGIHFIQEDATHQIGTALYDFLASLEGVS